MIFDQYNVNEQGRLVVAGCDTAELAKAYGTPLYVMDGERLRQNCRDFKTAIDKHCGGRGKVFYAVKALCCKEICRVVVEEGLGLDTLSGGELYTAQKAGVDAADICFEGNYKTPQELEMAVSAGVFRIVVDSFAELEQLNEICLKLGKKQDILLRIKPGIDTHTFEAVRTANIDAKFGFTLETDSAGLPASAGNLDGAGLPTSVGNLGEAMEAANAAAACKGLCLRGLHCHLGSQLLSLSSYIMAAEVMMDFYSDVQTGLGITMTDLDMGGGLGIEYKGDENVPTIDEFIGTAVGAVKDKCKALGIDMPFIMFEPGRAIVGSAGMTLYTAGVIKQNPGKNYVLVDGGMCDNPRYALYKSPYTVLNASKADKPAGFTATIAGRTCESGDMIQEGVALPRPETGDLIAVLATGAYNYSMSISYNRLPKPAMIMIEKGQPRLIVRRETLDDIIDTDI